jgi:hypothetical protein
MNDLAGCQTSAADTDSTRDRLGCSHWGTFLANCNYSPWWFAPLLYAGAAVCLRHWFWGRASARIVYWGRRFLVKSKSYTYSSKSTHFIIEVRGTDLVVSVLNGKFKATYYKATGQPHLILRERTRTDDHEMVDEAFRTAVAKARELGWIV